jgi:YgiT-type zinc finger domain-containing protein
VAIRVPGKEEAVICHRCGGSQVEEQVTDLPFKLDVRKILVVRQTPAFICSSCGETMLSDDVMARVDEIIEKVRDADSELDVVSYAA